MITGILIGIFIGYAWGWVRAHGTIATECRRLGGFYVGDSVFTCTEKRTNPKQKEKPDVPTPAGPLPEIKNN